MAGIVASPPFGPFSTIVGTGSDRIEPIVYFIQVSPPEGGGAHGGEPGGSRGLSGCPFTGWNRAIVDERE